MSTFKKYYPKMYKLWDQELTKLKTIAELKKEKIDLIVTINIYKRELKRLEDLLPHKEKELQKLIKKYNLTNITPF